MFRGIHSIALVGLWMALVEGVVLADGKIYWTDFDAGKIQRANLDGSGIEDVITGLPQPLAVALDVAGGKVYWVQANGIRRANLDGSNVETVNGIAARGIALDLGPGKLYLSESFDKGGWIFRANLDGSEFETLVSAVPDPKGIALDRDGGKIYWAGSNGQGFVHRANLDGSNIEVLVTIPQGTPWEIALDVAAGKMYWADAGTRAISRANLNGSNVQNLVTSANGLSGPVGIELDLVGGKIYWTDYVTKKVQRANLDGSNVEDVIAAGLSGPEGIALELHPVIPTVSAWGVTGLAAGLAAAGALVMRRRNRSSGDRQVESRRGFRKGPHPQRTGALLILGATVGLPIQAGAEPAEIPSQDFELTIDPGPFYGPACSGGCPAIPYVVDFKTVSQSGAPWIRVTSLLVQLAGSPEQGNASFLRLTSQLDDAVQILDAQSLVTWGNTSAYFNGDTVLVELLAYPDTGPNQFLTEKIFFAAGEPQTNCDALHTHDGYCDTTDERSPSNDPRTGRLVYQEREAPDCLSESVCTAFLFEGRPNWLMTAGHCCEESRFSEESPYCRLPVVEFNAPASTSGGDVQFADPSDQYPVDINSDNRDQGGFCAGDDWCFFGVFNNTDTGLTPLEAQGGSFRLARSVPAADGSDLRVTGYGLDDDPLGYCKAQQTAVGSYVGLAGTELFFLADTTPGNSGSPIEHDCRDVVYGILECSHCRTDGGNSGTSIAYPALVDALFPNEPGGTREPIGICAACTCDASGCGGSSDCNENSIKDECEFNEDCQPNGVQDICDIFTGTSDDLDLDSIPDECQGPVGACVFGTSSCLEMKSACCSEVSGEFRGDGIACSDLGACCSPGGTCEPNSTSELCAGTGGTFAGTGTTCAGIGPCCLPDGACVDVDATCCGDLGGIVKSGYSECSVIPYHDRCRPWEGPEGG